MDTDALKRRSVVLVRLWYGSIAWCWLRNHNGCRTYKVRDIYDNNVDYALNSEVINVVTANILMRIQLLSTFFCKISGIF